MNRTGEALREWILFQQPALEPVILELELRSALGISDAWFEAVLNIKDGEDSPKYDMELIIYWLRGQDLNLCVK